MSLSFGPQHLMRSLLVEKFDTFSASPLLSFLCSLPRSAADRLHAVTVLAAALPCTLPIGVQHPDEEHCKSFRSIPVHDGFTETF